MFQVDVLVRDEIESVYILSDSLICRDYPRGFLERSSEAMMMIVSLEPVVSMLSFRQITQVTDFHYSSAFFIAIFLHSLGTFPANLRIFACIAILTYEKNHIYLPELHPHVIHDCGRRRTGSPFQIYFRHGHPDAAQQH